MKALIFAAGRGERMRPLSDATAKPLLLAGGRRLIDWQLAALAAAGVREAVINTAHLAQQIEEALGSRSREGVRLIYSREGRSAEDALETLGGIVQALPLLAGAAGEEPFIAVSGDIVCDFDYRRLAAAAAAIRRGEIDAHLVLVDNPPFHPGGDMGLVACAEGGPGEARISTAPPRFTYANIGVFAPRIFRAEAPGRKKLFPWLYRFADAGRVGGELFRGRWHNVGTPDDLQALDAELLSATAPKTIDEIEAVMREAQMRGAR